MSCYNAERWLAESIESVLGQTWGDFEFIIVDDGSTDGTGRIVDRFASKDARIVPITKPNTGLADSLNVGIARARGVWIARLDADDLCESQRLELQWRVASADSCLVFVGTGLVLIDESGLGSSVHLYPTSHRKLLAHLTTARKFPAHSSALFRADAFRRLGGYRPRLRRSQDRDLWLRLSQIGKLASLHQPLVRIRRHSEQISYRDGGIRQLIDSHVAMVSYWLRINGFNDPVDGDAELYREFFMWISRRVEAETFVSRRTELRRSLKNIILRAAQVEDFRIALVSLAKPWTYWQIALERISGSDFPCRLADEWAAFYEKNERL